ncbi:MAG: hypothetical protein ABSG62_21195 [Terracidiphilus sp.]|jgi:hypothetical protein
MIRTLAALPAACAGGVASLFLPTTEAAVLWPTQTLQPGDGALVKGSRGVGLERAIEAVRTCHGEKSE